ncbi:DUF1918 domain-containing protein [Halocatena marina]|uniref:DUF1918 domain-containing protein n=1 Tax=Halocatena marina TaxID=2934937 RepID=A0ABD5YNE5_9EURY|nr:DUF1918 domain-containing protein [Halocatena marina]
MAFEEDESVVLHDQHSEHDGDTGRITQVMETMFGDATYTVSFEDGQEQGVPEDSLEPAADDSEDGSEAENETEN